MNGEIRPSAVHGRYVPGLSWDTLPPPVWELADGEMSTTEKRIRELNDELTLACEARDAAEEEVRAAEDREHDLRREIDAEFATLAKAQPGLVPVLRKELDL